MSLRDLFTPRTKHSDPAVRARAVASLTNQGELLAAALDTDEQVWTAAIDRLAAIAHEDGDFERLEVLANGPHYSEDQFRRNRYAADNLRSSRLSAVGQIKDSQQLAMVAIAAEDADVRNAALAGIDDQRLLAQTIAQMPHHPGSALACINDDQILCDLAINATSAETQRSAIERLGDSSVLAAIARDSGRSMMVREAAINRVEDSDLLEQLVIENAPVARLALARIGDPARLQRVALQAPDPAFRSDAIKRIRHVDTLLKIALEDDVSWIWDEALCRLRDLKEEKAIARVAKTAAPERRRRAIYFLTDSSLLFEIATSDADAEIRTLAAERVTDTALLRRLAQSDGAQAVAARKRLESSSVLVEDALRGESAEIRLAAIEKLRELDPLDEIMETAPQPALKEAAAQRRAVLKPWLDAQADIRRRIDELKASGDYRLELEIRTKEDHEGFVTPTLDQVQSLEFELDSLIKAGPTSMR